MKIRNGLYSGYDDNANVSFALGGVWSQDHPGPRNVSIKNHTDNCEVIVPYETLVGFIAEMAEREPQKSDIEMAREVMGCDCVDDFIAAGGVIEPGGMIPCHCKTKMGFIGKVFEVPETLIAD